MTDLNPKLLSDTIYLAYALFDPSAPMPALDCKLRSDYVSAFSDPLARSQRYWVWRLAQSLLSSVMGDAASQARFSRRTDGKWQCNFAEMSLSHSGTCVAAAIGGAALGVDVQRVDGERLARVQRRMSASATPGAEADPFRLAELWARNESAFKVDGGNMFVPAAVDTDKYGCAVLPLLDGEYVLCVAGTRGAVAHCYDFSSLLSSPCPAELPPALFTPELL